MVRGAFASVAFGVAMLRPSSFAYAELPAWNTVIILAQAKTPQLKRRLKPKLRRRQADSCRPSRGKLNPRQHRASNKPRPRPRKPPVLRNCHL